MASQKFQYLRCIPLNFTYSYLRCIHRDLRRRSLKFFFAIQNPTFYECIMCEALPVGVPTLDENGPKITII
jgi:hypothetical protein